MILFSLFLSSFSNSNFVYRRSFYNEYCQCQMNQIAANKRCNGVYTIRTYGVTNPNTFGTTNTGGEDATSKTTFPKKVISPNAFPRKLSFFK
mmetsp:Transcript_935/g.1986  ORF Transcript_935/g.1986 Transcript_935/m.1986 type:complete len:92 (+) Transcript_935:78-353(+)